MQTRNSFYSIAKLIIAIILFTTGCEHDYYQPKENEAGSGSSLFGDSITIPASFTWITTRNVQVSVKVDDNYNGQYLYTVQLFDANPLFDKQASVLGMGVAKNNSDFVSTIVLPDALQTVYIQQTSPTGGKIIAPVEVTSMMRYTFGAMANAAGTTLRSASLGEDAFESAMRVRAATEPYPVPALPGNHTVVTQSNGELSSNIAGDVYLINGNFSGTTNFWRKVDLFVQGTLNVTSGQLLLPPGSRLIVLPGASVTTPGIDAWGETSSEDIYIQGSLTVNGKFSLPKNSKLVVFEDGNVQLGNGADLLSNTVLYNNGTVQVSGLMQTSNTNVAVINDHDMRVHQLEITQNTGLFTNNGTLNVENDLRISNNGKVISHNTLTTNTLTLDNGTFENDGDVTVQGHTKATNNTARILNNNSFITNSMELQGKALVINNCHMEIYTMLNTTDSDIKIKSGGLLTTSSLAMNNTRIELEGSAIMKVNVEALYKYNKGGGSDDASNDGFYGTGGSMAVLQITKAVAENNSIANIIHYQGNLLIECYDHPKKPIDASNSRYTETGVTWSGQGGSGIVIPSTECNDGGYSNVPSTPPSNPVFPIIWNGSDVTYMFEDNWPLLGDYDMNDVVFNVKPTYHLNASDKVESLDFDVTLRAVGGIKRLAAGLQIDGMIRNSVSAVTRSNASGIDNSVFVTSNGLETGQSYVVIPLFDDVHQALGIPAGTMVNTVVGGSGGTVSPLTVSFSIVFNAPVDKASVSIDKLNPFIVNGGYQNKRHEVHMPGFTPTDKADIRRFGAGDDNSNHTYYTSYGNLIWSLAIPGNVRYPKEWTSIRNAYEQLEGWATSSGANNKGWYSNPVTTLVY